MTAILDPDDDDELASLVAESMALAAEKDEIAKARRKLADARTTAREKDELRAMVEAYDEARTWDLAANVALVHVQACRGCGHTAQFFMGWYMKYQHKTQAATQKLVSGQSPLPIPYRVERHELRPRDQCVFCLPAYIRARQAIIPYQLKRKEVRDED